MTKEQIIKHYIKKIIQKKYFIRIECEGFSSYYDMYGQRTCYLVQPFDHQKIWEYPLYLGLYRCDYDTFYTGKILKRKFYAQQENEVEFYRVSDKQPTVIGTVTITEEMVKNASIELDQHIQEFGNIKFKHMTIQFREDKP